MKIRQSLTSVIASLALLTGCVGDSNAGHATSGDAASGDAASGNSAAADLIKPTRDMEAYRALSAQLYKLDQSALEKEVQKAGLEKPLDAPHAKRFGFDVKLATGDAEFIASEEGRRIADIVLSFQTPSGGWSKRTDMGAAPRKPGQKFGTEKNYVPTFDNSATSVQFWVMVNACNGIGDKRYCESAERALKLILAAQYPNGGWPQTFPLRGDYHDDITFNDDAIANLLSIIGAAARNEASLSFIAEALHSQAQDSLSRALQMLANTQVVVNGKPTIWGAQHDAETLEPTAARAFEPVALATSESADILLFLMSLDNPSPVVKEMIESASQWFAERQIDGFSYKRVAHKYKELIADEDADPIWARFYDIEADKPVFGDRNGAVYFDINEVSEERRAGYGWYTEQPYKVMKKYAKWQKEWQKERQL